ncbi:hypothetical protein [Methylobacterium platani]|uniref:Uncharacterized protein n=2 Tax=Methylobacterium platani TaxID=427683 RepID=A0A179S684_9HYPH|nr:hypothetical protein [Methylobacterium platani]KMO11347.1 hypothetical protein SQ03_27370 [Methylobacterium platani JCM 14648]OAS22300.1 hypothetical protein A5481_20275 [Methylobacterium platani]
MTRHRARPSFTVEIKRSRTSPLTESERPQSERPVGKPLAGKVPAASLAAPAEPERKTASPGRNLWAGTGLFEEAAAATQSGRFDPPEPPVFAKVPDAKAPEARAFEAKGLETKAPADRSLADRTFGAAAPAKRVLPSLIAPPEPEPEPEVAPEPEPKLPRVRRYRTAEPAPRRAAGPRPAFVWPEDWPDEAPIRTPAPITVPAAPRAEPARIPSSDIEVPRAEAAPQAPEAGETRPRGKRRAGDEDLRIGQRWKRRLPRVCW